MNVVFEFFMMLFSPPIIMLLVLFGSSLIIYKILYYWTKDPVASSFTAGGISVVILTINLIFIL